VSASQEVCRALVLSGGGNKGAYEVGVIHGMVNLLPADDVKYDVVSGVSAGALNAAGMFIWQKGDEVRMADWLVTLWSSISFDMIFKVWGEGVMSAFKNHSGFLNDQPLFDLVSEILDSVD